ncbi:MAG: ABC transporter permease subunit [Moorea sp. SIO3E2]|uniref:ABC transporter permease n=1 Tax=Moorena sp. SIO4E2 TaxID=2607826 RepID=UPI0013B6628F|nr:ABC transporter permease [Moorena sp. SIO4E2]NEQ07408.1 ABC transporter permease subunit [Moorena sp. SIO4E2]NEQ12685.1 ABC transporter permease subunit [Moorena sp. SIO3E2]
MALNNLVNQLGELNPQVFRELKGRFKQRNVLITVAISLVGQLLMLIDLGLELPSYSLGAEINWPLWWQDVFVWLSLIGIFSLLVVGTYMLISDLSKEESRGTLNFLRLTPQSSRSILGGKLLGVPALLYLAVGFALPLHFCAAIAGQIHLIELLGFYIVLGSSCLFCYSMALLFGLVSRSLGGFQAWLGSGAVLIFLWFTTMVIDNAGVSHYPADWLTLFNPTIVLPYLIDSNSFDPNSFYPVERSFQDLRWFGIHIGASFWTMAGFIVLNYGVGTYWFGQGLNRCFHNPKATLINKQQSYWLTASFQAVILGFALNPQYKNWRGYTHGLEENSQMLLVFNVVLFLALIAALSPHRQTLQDWARYRHQDRTFRKKGGVIADLIWGDKSPAVVAVAINCAIASAMLLTWILLWPANEYKIPALFALLLNSSLIMIYATVAQLMLLMKTQKRAAGAVIAVGGLILLPPILFWIGSMTLYETPAIWLFSVFHWGILPYANGSVFLAIIAQSLALTLFNVQLGRQLRQAGESTTKALLSGKTEKYQARVSHLIH